ncbi:MAG TPA: transporter [Verrucomicrobiae bacterium]|nr:transporter [Verrucomicrobiae bacterium]
MNKRIHLLIGLFFGAASVSFAGPPYVTDDPVPPDYQHWEFYIASQDFETADGWSGTAPHIEINYGVFTNVQLHLIAPLAYDAPDHGATHYGYGDTELGVKYRFLQESKYLPQIGIFPLLEVPTGDESKGLGSGQWDAFLPVWLQKSFGAWTIDAGGGYGINPGPGNKDWGLVAALLQYQVRNNISVGGEIYHRTQTEADGPTETAFNIGAVVDFSDHQHFLFSAGRSIDGPTDFQVYAAWQFTFGPELFHSLADLNLRGH